MKVPFFGYSARFASDRDLIRQIVAEVGASDTFILKNRCAQFETLVREYTGVRHALAVASGTSALTICLGCMGVGPGTDVITPAFSFIASASAIVHRGARPIFVDVDAETCTLNPAAVEASVTPASRVVIPVHLFSAMADMTAITRVADKLGLQVLEDSAVALGARMGGTAAGLLGDMGLYSFFPAKPLGGIGDAGLIVTNNDELATRARMLRNHGQDGITRFLHHHLGYNHRMDEVMAAYLTEKFSRLPEIINRRAAIAHRYNERLSAMAPAVRIPPAAAYDRVYYTYVIQAEKRDQLRAYLAQHGIETQVYYPIPLHLQPAFAYLGYKAGDFPNAERLSQRTLALPLYPEMTNEQAEIVAEAVAKFYA